MKYTITFAIAIVCFFKMAIAQDSTKTLIDSFELRANSLQAIGDSVQKINDSVQTLSKSVQVIDEIQPLKSPYITSFKKDGPIILAGLGLTGLGVYLIQHKKDLTNVELATKTKGSIPFFDRGNAGFYSDKTNDASYIPFDAAFAMPVIMMVINKNERHKFGQVAALYVETMAITGAMFTITAGVVDRSRPLVYGTKAPLSLRLAKKSQRSFYAGHVAATAAATFFAARVFQDFNPESKAKFFVWTVAAAIPAVTGYLRYKSGMHFLSDNILGYIIGAGTGILIPGWHKNKVLKNVAITPEAGRDYKGIALSYRF